MEVIIDQVSKSFRNGKKVLPVLEDINITLHKEEFVALVGPSGCGKSTLLNICAGLLSPDAGSVYFTGEDLKSEPRVSIVFQETGLMPGVTYMTTSPLDWTPAMCCRRKNGKRESTTIFPW